MRAHADAPYVQLIVNEGGGAGASLEHTHAQLYALPFVPAAVARERERVGAYARTHRRRRPAQRRPGRGGAAQGAAGRDRRGGGAGLPLGLALALRAAGRSRAGESPALPRTRRARRCSHTALRLLAKRFGGPPELNLWVRTAPRGDRALPLARRHRPAALDQGELRARHRRRHQHLPARAGREPTCARRWANRLPAVPPNPRPIPRFIADITQEGIPHGRFAERLGEAFRKACDGDRRPARRRRGRRASSTGSRSAPGAGGSGSPAAPGPTGPRASWSSSATSPTSSRRRATRPTSAPRPTSPTSSPRTTPTGRSTSTTR